MSALTDYATLASRLVHLTAQQARATRGQFTGASASVLVIASAFLSGGENAFRAIAADPTRPDPDRVVAQQMGRLFGDARTTIATRFTSSGVVQTLDALKVEPLPGQPSVLAQYAPAAAALVSITPTAQAALDELRRDPLTLGSSTAALAPVMAAVVAGLVIVS